MSAAGEVAELAVMEKSGNKYDWLTTTHLIHKLCMCVHACVHVAVLACVCVCVYIVCVHKCSLLLGNLNFKNPYLLAQVV